MRYRFAVIEAPKEAEMDKVKKHRSLYDTKYAALYYPWLVISDPFPKNPRVQKNVLIPPIATSGD